MPPHFLAGLLLPSPWLPALLGTGNSGIFTFNKNFLDLETERTPQSISMSSTGGCCGHCTGEKSSRNGKTVPSLRKGNYLDFPGVYSKGSPTFPRYLLSIYAFQVLYTSDERQGQDLNVLLEKPFSWEFDFLQFLIFFPPLGSNNHIVTELTITVSYFKWNCQNIVSGILYEVISLAVTHICHPKESSFY